jgi:type I restriction enzyme R subunit
VSGGAGNPANPNGYSTSYLWEEVLSKDSLLDIIHKFVSFVETKDVDTGKINTQIIFPRYHQYDCVNKVMDDVKVKGSGQNYLIEHSAGSGKSNTIAWIAYRLASVHDEDDKAIFSSIIVVTDRIVLDSQLQDTINSFEHTPGLVEAIDDKKRSKGLIEAINARKRIIICTIQKFLYAYKEFNSMENRNFAIIIDEAHQGQSGESARTLRKALIDGGVALKEYAKEEGIDPADVDVDDEIISDLVAQGRHKNQSFFAFTATPKNKTLEIFGRKNTKGQYLPFHIYSMKQAIEEGFILDVLKDFIHIKESFKIIKTTQDNPELVEGQATNALVRYYKEHGHTIDQKVDVIMANFLNNGRFKINGKGKAMVVSDSRHNAVRYYFAIKKYIKDHPKECANVDALVAFSGVVKLNNDPKEYTEANLNKDEEGKYINSDKRLRQAFRSDKFNILVVANKYQTGFDEPLLHSMYVDKKLKGVNATQTLSRLNRTYPGKTDTFILDFVNTNEEIKEAFQPFYEMTYLEKNSDFNMVYDLRTKVRKYRLYNDNNITRFVELMKENAGKKQDEVALGKITSLFKPITDMYNELDEDERYKFRITIRKFNQSYSFITQLVRLNDKELFSEYLFTSYLVNLLPINPKEYVYIGDKIQLEYASLKEEFNGSIKLETKDTGIQPSSVNPPSKQNKTKDTLQSIIDKVNEKFDGNFSESDKVIVESIFKMFMEDSDIKKFKKYAKDNNTEMFIKSLFPDKFKELVSKCYFENDQSYQKLLTDEVFLNQVMEVMGKELYRSLRNKESYLVLGVYPVHVGSVLNAIVGHGTNQRFDQDWETVTVNLVEARWLLVDTKLDSAIWVLDESVLFQYVLSGLVVSGHKGQNVLFHTSLITKNFGLSRRADEDEVLSSAITEILRRVIVAQVMGESHKELVGHRGGWETTNEVNVHLVITSGHDLAEAGSRCLRNNLGSRENQHVGANISRVKRLDGVLKVLFRNAVRILNCAASLIKADGWALAAKGLKGGNKFGLTEFSLWPYGSTLLDCWRECRSGKALVSNHTIGYESADAVSRIALGGSAINDVSPRIVISDVADRLLLEGRNLRCNSCGIVFWT